MSTITANFGVHPKAGIVAWVVNEEGRIVSSLPMQNYTGCHVADMADLAEGKRPSYFNPMRTRRLDMNQSIIQITTD